MATLTARDLNASLWAAADEMRRVMSADVYKDYLLGLVFYKALSDKMLVDAFDLVSEEEDAKPESLEAAQTAYEEAFADAETWEDLKAELLARYGCVIMPTLTFTALYRNVNKRTFMLSDLRTAFRNIEASGNGIYEGLFEDFDVDSKDLGKTPDKRNEMIASVIKALAHIDFNDYPEDALGDAYEYLISQFASESGKKAGEFYTPQSVAKIIAKIVTHGQNDRYGFSVYDPTMGSGSLLLQIRNCIENTEGRDNKSAIHFFGQELKNQTYNLARMNMMLHRVKETHQHLRNGDTLDADWPTDEPTNFDAVVMNPPYSQKYDARENLLTDPRFVGYKKLPPASKADFAFLLHGFYHLKDSGTMGIVLPHGVLFRGGSEGTIRETLLRNGNIYAVIGLPSGIFFSTGIPTCIVILKKNNADRSVLFIDGSKEFEKIGPRNFLTPENIDKIVDAYTGRADIEGYSHLASSDEIEENEYNLNISRYITANEEVEFIDLNKCLLELEEYKKEESKVEQIIAKYLVDLPAFSNEEGVYESSEIGSRLQEKYSNWRSFRLSDIVTITKQTINPQDHPERVYLEYSMPAYDNGKNPNLSSGKSMESSRLSISGDVILFNKLNIRKQRIWNLKNLENNSLCSTEFLPLEPSNVNQDFLYYLLSTTDFTNKLIRKSSGTSNSQKRIKGSDLLAETVFCPEIDEQQKIASFFLALDRKIELNEYKLESLKKLREGAMQRIFEQNMRSSKQEESVN